jgi:hypothetical protein
VSKEVVTRSSRTPMTFHHAMAMTAVGVVGALVAFWILGSVLGTIFGIFVFAIKIAVIAGLIGGAFWLVSRFKR